MKFDCGLSSFTKDRLRLKWHKAFLWFPKRFSDNDCRWLEWVWRKEYYEHDYRGGWRHKVYRTQDGVLDFYNKDYVDKDE